MTEAQAYDKHGWPHEGRTLALVLPLSGSTETDWHAHRCPTCGMRSVGRAICSEPIDQCVNGCGQMKELVC